MPTTEPIDRFDCTNMAIGYVENGKARPFVSSKYSKHGPGRPYIVSVDFHGVWIYLTDTGEWHPADNIFEKLALEYLNKGSWGFLPDLAPNRYATLK